MIDGKVIGIPKASFIEEDYYDDINFSTDYFLEQNYGELSLRWEGGGSNTSLPLRLFNHGFEEICKFVNYPKNSDYMSHIAGMHAFRDMLLSDDLNKLAGVYFKIDVPDVDNPLIKYTLQVFDHSPVNQQVEAFCELHSLSEETRKEIFDLVASYFDEDIPLFE